ncbi:MAG: hypothetical protein J6P65_06075 [Bacteroidales bacterium]|nr:hypothetical protein [Bacteroidales bacterium]
MKKNKNLIKKIIESKYPITMMMIQPMKTTTSIKRIDISIEYDNGLKYITDDFYKHISTIKEQ